MLLYEDHKATPDAVATALAFSPDGSALASAAKDGSVFIRDSSGRLHTITEHTFPERHSKKCKDGSAFAGDSSDFLHTIKEKNLPERNSNGCAVYSLTYSPDGLSLFIGGAFGWIGSKHDGELWRVFGPENAAPVTSLAMLDDRTLAVGIGDRVQPSGGKLELWDVVAGRKREPSFLEPNGVRAVAVCPERRMVAWATGHRQVAVWEIVRQQPIQFTQPKNTPALALSPDGKLLAVAVDYGVKVYSIERKQPRFELKGHKGRVAAVVFSPDGSTIATGSWDMSVKLWDAAKGQERTTFRWPIGRVLCLAYAPDGLRLAASGDAGSTVVWDLE
ncbi:MAG TPA: hypothetical protein VLM40_03075 [Gemmata sp.]|nr:hypothetical protein [Gemmata sp.]